MLDIKTRSEGKELTIELAGRLDTNTALSLDKAVTDHLAGVETLVLDCAQLEYLSSAGLRVLLRAQQAMSRQGEMVLKNCRKEIMEVFELTGFADILTFA